MSKKFDSPFISAARNNEKSKLISLFKKYEKEKNYEGGNFLAIHAAAKYDNPDCIKICLDYGTDINCKSVTSESTPLHIAAMYDNISSIHFLLDNGAEINAQQFRGYTPLFLAVKNELHDSVLILLRRGADISILANYEDFIHDSYYVNSIENYVKDRVTNLLLKKNIFKYLEFEELLKKN